MSRVVLLDAGPLGMVSNPHSNPEAGERKTWLASMVQNGIEDWRDLLSDFEQALEAV
ncbi:MAG: hypothetical protein NT090_17600 [Acidobacteria bacterium]|nr:hypothetical protein [Acidobacteriota bacterium]